MPFCISGLRTAPQSPEVLRRRSFLAVAVMASGFDVGNAAVGAASFQTLSEKGHSSDRDCSPLPRLL
jgi:hypothetical protein